MTGLLDNIERRSPPTTTRHEPWLLDGDLAEAIRLANEQRALATREQDEQAIAEILRESLKKVYGDSIEEPREPSTRTTRQYIAEFAAFARYCLLQHALPEFDPPRSLPAKGPLVASYLHRLASDGAHSTKLRRASAAISRAHRLAQLPDPTSDVLVAGVLRAARAKAPARKKKLRKRNGAKHH